MWLFYSLLAPLFFAIVHVMDSYCVEDVFEKPWMGMVTSAIASLIVFAPLPYIAPFIDWQMPTVPVLIAALAAGALIQLSQALYFQALSYSEAGIVAAYWNMVPMLVPILSLIFLHERLSALHYIAISILIFCSVAFCLIDTSIKTRWLSFALMAASAVMQAFMFLLQEVVYSNMSYYQGFIVITTGLIITGLIPLVFKRVRIIFISNKLTLIKSGKLFVYIEIANLLALAFSQRAVDLGIPSLVAAVESTIPAYTFILSLLLSLLLPSFGDERSRKKLPQKFILIFFMASAVASLT